MSEPNDADKGFAESWTDLPYAVSEETADLAYAARDYRQECERAERERVLGELHAWLDPMPDTQELQMLAEFLYTLKAGK